MSNESSSEKVYLQKARLMELLQTLKKRNAKIQINLDVSGEERVATYGPGEDCEFSLKELLETIWDDTRKDGIGATEAVIYKYFSSNFEVDLKSRAYSFLPPKGDIDPAIKNVKAHFRSSSNIENREKKQEMFFGGLLPQATNVLVAFPSFRQQVIHRLESFTYILESSTEGFPYQQLRDITELRCYRHKLTEKGIFQYLKESDGEALKKFKFNLLYVLKAYVEHLKDQEANGVSTEEPHDEKLLTNKLTYHELSDPQSISITDEEITRIEKTGFQTAFSVKERWFDDLRLKKLDYWKANLSHLKMSNWPDYYVEHYLAAYIELNVVCEELLQIRKDIFQEIGFDVTFSEDGVLPKWTQKVDTLEQLASLLSNYIYESNAFVRKIRADGYILQKPLYALRKPLREDYNKPDKTYYSRVERLQWKYILIHLCDCCHMNKDWIENHHDPISKRQDIVLN